jgi:hypothetical protein
VFGHQQSLYFCLSRAGGMRTISSHIVSVARVQVTDIHMPKSKDALEWTNLAAKPEHADVKRDLAKWLPKVNTPPRPSTIPQRSDKPGAKSGPGPGR